MVPPEHPCRSFFVSRIAFFAFLFASLLSLVANSVILLFRLGATPPPRCLRAWSMRIPLACCLLSCVLGVDWFHFFSLPSLFSISILETSFVPSCLFLGGTMLSPRFRFLLRLVQHMIYMYLDTYVSWSHLFIFVWVIRFVSVIVCIIFCFCLFSSWGNFPLQSYWSLSCDHGRHCSDELMWEQQQQPSPLKPISPAKILSCSVSVASCVSQVRRLQTAWQWLQPHSKPMPAAKSGPVCGLPCFAGCSGFWFV